MLNKELNMKLELKNGAVKLGPNQTLKVVDGAGSTVSAIEGAVCTFLLPYWSQGGEIIRDDHLSFERAKAEAGLDMWQSRW